MYRSTTLVFGEPLNIAHDRARIRRLTLFYRRLWKDQTQDNLSDETWDQVLVGGIYRNISRRADFGELLKEKTFATILRVRENTTYNTYNVKLDGPGCEASEWYYVPKAISYDRIPRVNDKILVWWNPKKKKTAIWQPKDDIYMRRFIDDE